MGKNILAVVSSPRKGGNSETLVEQFVKGAKESGNEVETLFLRDKKIAPCIACDMAEVLQKIIAADVIVLSTPVYYYSVSAQLKAMIDRTLAGGGKMKNKEFYFIATAADGKEAMECTMNDMQGFVRCIPGSIVKGKVYGSAFRVGEIKGKPAMEEAYQLGVHC